MDDNINEDRFKTLIIGDKFSLTNVKSIILKEINEGRIHGFIEYKAYIDKSNYVYLSTIHQIHLYINLLIQSMINKSKI